MPANLIFKQRMPFSIDSFRTSTLQSLHGERLLCERCEAQCIVQADETDCIYMPLNSKSQKEPRRNAHPHACLPTAAEAEEWERITREADRYTAEKQADKAAADHQRHVGQHYNADFKVIFIVLFSLAFQGV